MTDGDKEGCCTDDNEVLWEETGMFCIKIYKCTVSWFHAHDMCEKIEWPRIYSLFSRICGHDIVGQIAQAHKM